MASNAPTPAPAPAQNGQQNTAASNGAAAKRPRGGNSGPRKASPKVKALIEVRTFIIQHRSKVEKEPVGVDRDIQLETYDRMLDAVESLFPKGHTFTIKRPGGESATPQGPTE